MGHRQFLPFRGVLGNRLALTVLVVATIGASVPATAQDAALEPRVKKLESEMRAVQRKVFPGGSERFFEPEISAPKPPAQTDGMQATTPVADLLLRVDSIESRLATLTGQVEENSYKLGQMEDRLAALEAKAAAAEPAVPVSSGTGAASGGAATTAPVAAAPSPARVEAVSAIVKPDSGDAGDDNYIYGYRLWEAKFFPEAQTQLKMTVEKYPNHSRISFARNLLGRAYLDDGKPTNAATVLFDNYQKNPKGERAPDSLYYLGVALTQLKKKSEACTAYKELAEVYPDVATGRLADRLAAGRIDAGCK